MKDMNTSGLNNVLQKYTSSNAAMKLIVINAVIFALFFLVDTILHFFGTNSAGVQRFFALNADWTTLLYRPWTIISYAFLHSGFLHVFFNMVILHLAGNLFLQFFNTRQFLSVYVPGVIIGGLLFMLGVNFLPIFNPSVNTQLVGASAGIFALLVAVASYAPNYRVQLLFFGRVKLWHIALVLVILDLVNIQHDGNEGGHLAHFGGMVWGFIYTLQNSPEYFKSGWTVRFSKIFRRKSHLKLVHKAPPRNDYEYNARKSEHQMKVDQILDKISASGYESLSSSEKEFLLKASNKND